MLLMGHTHTQHSIKYIPETDGWQSNTLLTSVLALTNMGTDPRRLVEVAGWSGGVRRRVKNDRINFVLEKVFFV